MRSETLLSITIRDMAYSDTVSVSTSFSLDSKRKNDMKESSRPSSTDSCEQPGKADANRRSHISRNLKAGHTVRMILCTSV